jgi:hypothetical protein
MKTMVLLLACVLISPTGAHGNPSSSKPDLGLKPHGTIDGAKALAASLYQLYNEEEPIVAEMFDNMKSPDQVRGENVERSAGRAWKALRDADRLTLMGESAGPDLATKFQRLHRVIHDFALRFRSTPQGEKLRQRSFKNLERDRKRMPKFLSQAAAALEREKFDIFEKQMEAKGVELHEGVVFFSIAERNKYLHPFLDVLARGDAMIRPRRSEQFAQAAIEFGEQQFTAASALVTADLNDATAASDSVQRAFADAVKRWGDATAAITRADAAGWSITGKRNPEMTSRMQQINSKAIDSLIALIEKAAAETPADQLAETYSGLLTEISFAQRRMNLSGDSLQQACAPAIEKLLAKKPAMKSQVQAYTRATAEPLAWRQAFASELTKAISSQSPSVNQLISSSSPVPSTKRPSFAGPTSTKDTVIAPDRFIGPASWMISDAAPRLIGKSVSQQHLLRISPASGVCIVPLQDCYYVYVAKVPAATVHDQDLRAALLVDDSFGPLSAQAADAVSASEMNDCEVVGGVITEVHLESMMTRLAALPNAASVLTPLGKMPAIDSNLSPLSMTCWRLDLQPTWIQNRYYFAKLGE